MVKNVLPEDCHFKTTIRTPEVKGKVFIPEGLRSEIDDTRNSGQSIPIPHYSQIRAYSAHLMTLETLMKTPSKY